MLTISRKNSTRFVDSKKSCVERSRIYDVRKKTHVIVAKNHDKEVKNQEVQDDLEVLELLVPHVESHQSPQYLI